MAHGKCKTYCSFHRYIRASLIKLVMPVSNTACLASCITQTNYYQHILLSQIGILLQVFIPIRFDCSTDSRLKLDLTH